MPLHYWEIILQGTLMMLLHVSSAEALTALVLGQLFKGICKVNSLRRDRVSVSAEGSRFVYCPGE